jgi:hypothetical protein
MLAAQGKPVAMVLAFVLALVGLGLTVLPITHTKARVVIGSGSYVAALGLLAWLAVPDWFPAAGAGFLVAWIAALLIAVALGRRRTDANLAPPAIREAAERVRRVGIVNRPGGTAKVRNDKFGPVLDAGVDNQGDLDDKGSTYH